MSVRAHERCCLSSALPPCLLGCHSFQHLWEQRWQSWGAHPSPPSLWCLLWLLPVCGSGAASPLFAPWPCEAFPPSHQQQVLSLRSNAGTESIPRQMFLRPLTQD